LIQLRQNFRIAKSCPFTEYGCSNWRWWLNNVTISAGLQNVTDEDPPFVAGSFENGYDESLATIKGRFWYVQLKKRF
jgi:outer membrane receptor protein involved in Fe transport